MQERRVRVWRSVALGVVGAALCALLGPAHVSAQIDAPGRHPQYNAELEGHLVWQWTGDEAAIGDGIGLGVRAAIPILQNGPVSSINNNLAIAFGLDWAYFSDRCFVVESDCAENDIWVPITLQWNFFLTPIVSVFPELGLGFRDAILDYDVCARGRRCSESVLTVRPVFWLGARFRVWEPVAIVVRLGTPALHLGASFTF